MSKNAEIITDKKFYSLNGKTEKLKNKIKENKDVEIYEKITSVNVDSKFRNKEPKNLLENTSVTLDENPLNFTSDSNQVKISYSNHTLEVDDRIVMSNVTVNPIYIQNSLTFIDSSQYVLINHPDHKISSTLFDQTTFELTLDNIIGLDGTNYIGNIFVNILKELYEVFVFSKNDDNTYSLVNETITDLNDKMNTFLENINNILTETELVDNYYVIKMPIKYQGGTEKSLYNDLIDDLYTYLYEDIITITFRNIAGIPLNLLNANYPIDSTQLQGFHTISAIDSDNIYIDLSVKAINTITNTGGENIIVTKVLETIDGFPNPNNYTFKLGKTFQNIVRIDMISSEFFNGDKVIKDFPDNLKNNKIYWQNIEDGDHIYSIEIPSGNYIFPTDLITLILSKMNEVERISSNNISKKYHEFDISLNTSNNEITFNSYKSELLSDKPLRTEQVIIDGETRFKLIITHASNSVNVGDKILISNSLATQGIPADIINSTHTVTETNTNESTYTILLPKFNLESSTSNTGGGNRVTVRVNLLVKLFFNYSDTLGKILGFREVGNEIAVTKFASTIKNTDLYSLESSTNIDATGNEKNEIIPQLNFTGDNLYFLLFINDFGSIVTSNDLDDAFAKIQLSGIPSDVLFNTFVQSPVIFERPLQELSELRIKCLYPDGNLVQFNNVDHSFTLRITERITKQKDTMKISRLSDIQKDTKQFYNI